MNPKLVNENGTAINEWSFDLIDEYYHHIEKIAKEKFNIDYYPNQIEVISSEQMLDAYSSVGLPINYGHWSFGKQFAEQLEHYKRGYMGLAYEIVINSNPCISYLMEENTMMMQILVIAHAAFGHNSFFKNNYLFKEWTDADSIIDYLAFAKKYISECEEKYGPEAVEEVLDSCHALNDYGVDKYKRPLKLSAAQQKERQKEREIYRQKQINDLWRLTIPQNKNDEAEEKRFPSEPQENILQFIEENAPYLDEWKREIIHIIRNIAQYFYPQRQTKVMNEGWASFIHYHIMHELYAEKLIPEGYMLAFYESHSGVLRQLSYNHPSYSGMNPYALGFAIFQDIKRISMEPNEEDLLWFGQQKWVGNGNWLENVHWAMKNFKDESFIKQFLSPKVIRDFKLFSLVDDEEDPKLEISAIHDKQGYKHVRNALANSYKLESYFPDIQVYNVNTRSDRTIILRHYMVNNRPLHKDDTLEVLKHVKRLWGFNVVLESVDSNDEVVSTYNITDDKETLLDIFLN